MVISRNERSERVLDVCFDEYSVIVDLMDGRIISAPLARHPRLLNAKPEQRSLWEKMRRRLWHPLA
jgi:hypothetical protein